MPVHSAEHWLQKADLARKTAEQMRDGTAKNTMLEIVRLYEHLAEQVRRLEPFKWPTKAVELATPDMVANRSGVLSLPSGPPSTRRRINSGQPRDPPPRSGAVAPLHARLTLEGAGDASVKRLARDAGG